MKKNILSTDFYQLPMVLAYILSGKAEETTGFESFYRHPKKEVNEKGYYYFSGEKAVKLFIEQIREEIKEGTFVETFIKLIMPKVRKEKRKEYTEKVRDFFKNCNKEFEYSVFKEDCILLPYVPAFQFKGPKWIGQLIETPITNIINGKTGLNTQRHLGKATQFMIDIVEGNRKSNNWDNYLKMLNERALEYVSSTDIPLMDASFRRAAGYKISVKTAEIALKNGFKATSNIGAYFDSQSITEAFIGGTMAHAFIMSFETELEAYKAWYEIFPGTAILVDTYDTINAVKMLIENNLKPDCVRIDSGDFFVVCKEVRTILDNAGWNKVGIYISGDLTPELLTELEDKKVPFNKAMIGTKLANIGEIVKINPGFVYKVVEYTTKEGKRILPEKKAEGKGNYPGLKVITVENGEVVLNTNSGNIGFNDLNMINEEMTVKYIRGE